MAEWEEVTPDKRLQELLHGLIAAEFDDVAAEQALDDLTDYLEELIGYCDAELLDGNDCTNYRSPGCGLYCEAHKEIGE